MKKDIKDAIKEHLRAKAVVADPNNLGFVDRLLEHTKAAEWGAEWRINSVWHDASEVPEERRFCLYILKDGTYGCGYYHKEDNSIWYSRFTNIVKWAYFQDITPNMED